MILRGGRDELEATTDERGEFKIPGLEPGTYFVAQLERSGYVADGKANRDETTRELRGTLSEAGDCRIVRVW